MKLLWSLAAASRRQLLCAVLSSVLAGAGASLLVGSINESLGAGPAELRRLGLQFGVLGLGMLCFRWLSQSQFVELSELTLARLRLHVSRHFAQAPYAQIEAQGAGRLLSILTEDVTTVSDFFVTLPRFVMHGAVVLGCLGYLAWLSLPVFAIALCVVAAGLYGHVSSARRARPHLWQGRQSEDRLYDLFRALFSGAKELQLNAQRRFAFLSELLGPTAQAVRSQQSKGFRIHAASASVRIFSFYVVIGAVIFWLGPALGLDERVRTGYALMFLYMLLPLHALVEASPEISRTRVALDRIGALGLGTGLGAALPRTTPGVPAAGTRSFGALERLELREVSYHYRREGDDGVFELGPLDLQLVPGEVVFLIGGNGSGKTTLAKLLVGLYEPRAGRVSWNGAPVGESDLEAYRQNFSAVFSDFHLFEGLLGLSSRAVEQRAGEWLRVLDLAHKVTLHPGSAAGAAPSSARLSTVQLSRGQRKRLALLVALLEDRPVYVFDEWAADQDPAYKEVFYRRVLPELASRGKAVLVITHDERYFPLAGRCLRLDSGRLR